MRSLLQLLAEVVAELDDLEIPYVLGGSVASSLVGEPRSTVDVDVAILVRPDQASALLDRMGAELYVPTESARQAIADQASFNVLDPSSGLKVDLFVLSDSLLDRRQMERRVQVQIDGVGRPIWVTSPEDQILRKLDRYQQGGGRSDRRWRDIVGILRLRSGLLDLDDLQATAAALGLREVLAAALADAADRG